jgi:hypothetical protein
VGEYPRGTFRFKKLCGSLWKGETLRFADYKYVQQLQTIKDNYATFSVPYNGEDNNDYVDGKGFCCNDGSLEAAQARVMARAMKNNFQEGDSYEKMQFYYHPDHFSSSKVKILF